MSDVTDRLGDFRRRANMALRIEARDLIEFQSAEIERLTAALDAETERCASILEANLSRIYDAPIYPRTLIAEMLAAIRGDET